ncbi:MAG: LacI family transcriptional regulator [Lachnospiraceae bacterium]|nr:LacI family transcriptional regulator [Lachnospiraceae bacterium]
MERKKITIDDVANALNISKTTVSRAISGKGRISSKTREMVLEFIKENNYKPNPNAKGLAENKTYNIAVVWPADYDFLDLPFFQRCVVGISKITSVHDTDILICMTKGDDIGELKRIVENRKADGVILTRTLVEDPAADYLLSKDFPFVAIGYSDNSRVITVDNNNFEACRELTYIIAMKKTEKIALLGGNPNHFITMQRYRGFLAGLKKAGLKPDERFVSFSVDTERKVSDILDHYIKLGANCVMCMDDMISSMLMRSCKERGIAVPSDIRVASFYDSKLLSSFDPPVTAVNFNDLILDERAAGSLLDMIDGKTVTGEVISDYEIILKGSTK